MRNVAIYLITLVCLVLHIQLVQGKIGFVSLEFFLGLTLNTNLADYPKPFQEIYVGYQEHVCYNASKYTANDTVTFFFDEDRSSNVARKL